MRNFAIALIVVGLGAGFAWKNFHKNGVTTPGGAAAAPGAGAPAGMPVEAEVIKARNVAQEIIAVGSLRSNESVTISSEIAGRISQIHFSEGQPVSKGARLIDLDDSVFRAETAQARAALTLSQRNQERGAELFERKLISARERDEIAAKLDVDKATVALAEAHLAKAHITAPFAGVIGLRSVSPGDYINPGQALAPLEQIQTLKADFRLSEAALSAIAVGQTLNLEVDAYPGVIFPGKVYAIDPRLAEESRSVGVRARVPNDKLKLRPGLFARVRLTIAQHNNAVMVPEQAILPQGEQMFVYVIEDGKAVMKPVKIGLRQAGRAEITSGIAEGDVVITAGTQKIGPGAPVMAINLAPSPAPAAAPDAGKPDQKKG